MTTLWQRRWMFAPAFLTAASIGFGAFSVRLALRDHGTAGERDYYRKAAEWDERRSQREAGESLRWTVSPSIVRRSAAELDLELTVADKYGIPIEGAEISVEGIPIRAADRVESARLRETTSGRYRGAMLVTADGQWEFRVDLRRGEARLVESFRRVVAASPGVAQERH